MAYFPNGTSFMDWSSWNCDRCIHALKEDDYCRIMELHDELNYQADDKEQEFLNLLIPMDEEGLFPQQCSMFHEVNEFIHEWDGIGTRFRNEIPQAVEEAGQK